MGEWMKEVKIRLSEEDHKRLRKAAKKNLRSMNKQVSAFINEGLQREQAAVRA